jgi:hypothetical protein
MNANSNMIFICSQCLATINLSKFFGVCTFLLCVHMSFQKLIFLEWHILLFSNSSLYFPFLFCLFPSLHHILCNSHNALEVVETLGWVST